MAGLCGWFHHQETRADHETVTQAMADALDSFDASRRELASNGHLGVASASLGAQALAFIDDGLGIALHGRVRDSAGNALPTDRLGPDFVATYRQGGIDAVFAAFSGPFSFILIDDRRQLAYAATDRLGICPVCYSKGADGSILFGSNSHCLGGHPAADRTLSRQSIFDYLFFHIVPSPRKAYAGHHALQPGEYVRCDALGVSVGRYWQMHYEDEPSRFDLAAAKQETHRLTEQAVRRVADTDAVGAFLSGGVDSSTVAGKLRDVRGEANTFSIGFSADGFDEMAFARQSATHFGARHHEYYVTPDDIVEIAPRVASVYDTPFGNASAIGAYFCAKLAADQGMTLILGGDGGDELFAGNERYVSQFVFERYQRLPAALRNGLLEPLLHIIPAADRLPLVRKVVSYVSQANTPMPDRLQSYNLLLRLGIDTLLTRDFLGSVEPTAPVDGLRAWYTHGSDAENMLQHMLSLDLKLTLADNDLPKVSRMCELAGIEVAYPMLDEDLLAFSGRIPSEISLHEGQLRWFFKEAMRGYLPDETLTKKKQGFGLPFGVWCRNELNLRSLAGDSLSDLKRRGIVNPGFIDELWEKLLPQHPTYYGTLIYLLLMLELWLQHHDPGFEV